MTQLIQRNNGVPTTPATLWYRYALDTGRWDYNHLELGHSTTKDPIPPCGQSWKGRWHFKHVWLTNDVIPKVTFAIPDDFLD